MVKPTYTPPPNDAPVAGSPTFASDADGYLGWFSTFGTYMQDMSAWLTDEYMAELQNGAASSPSVSFQSDPDTGIYWGGTDKIGFSTGGNKRALLTNTGFEISVPLTGTAVQSGALDTTGDRLLKTGAFGFGATGSDVPGDNLDNLVTPGCYRITNAVTAATPSISQIPTNVDSGSSLFQFQYSSTEAAQILAAHSTGDYYTRIKDAGVWTVWKRLLNTSDPQASRLDVSTDSDLVRVDGALHASLSRSGGYFTSASNENIDNAVAGDAGLYHSDNPGTFPPGASGSFFHITTRALYGGGAAIQTAVLYTSSGAPVANVWVRVRSNSGGIWSTWRGLIPEYGSNANGRYAKFADGTMVCWEEFLLEYTGSATFLNAIWSYPAAFSDRAHVIMTPIHASDPVAPAGATYVGDPETTLMTRTTGATSATLYAASPPGVNWVSADKIAVAVVAHGRWF